MAGRGMHPEDIKAAIRKTGITLRGLALRNGLSESAVRQAIIVNSCPAGDRVVIEYLGLHPHAIWPDRYDRDGNRVVGRTKFNPTKIDASGHRQKGATA